jgi:flagellar biosynthesis protein FlhG
VFGVNDQAARLRSMARRGAAAPAAAPARVSPVCAGRATLCRSIAVTSGKGGVGKSNIALLLAQSLARCGKRVLLFDADLGLANIHILLGMNPRHNLSHVVNGECGLEEIVCGGPGGISIIPGASGVEAMANLDAVALESLVRALTKLEARHDFMIIDIGAGIGQASMRISAAADTALLVLTPEPTSLADAYATAKVLFSRGMAHVSVMVNMAVSDREGTEMYEKLRALVKNFLKKDIILAGVLPLDKDIPRCIRTQRNLFLEKPAAAVLTRIGGYARGVCGMPAAASAGFFARLFARKKEVGV